MITGCEFRPTPPNSGRESTLRLRCRDFYFVLFHFHDHKAAHDAFSFIKTRSCRLGSIEKLHAFHYHAPKQERAINGWQLYDAKAEFRRQGIGSKLPDRGWRVSDLNADYSFSPTYPSVLVVPNRISDATLKYAAPHRTRARVPTLTYLHPINNCSITRSSQPRVGITGNRNRQDEALVEACFSNPYIQDAPPERSANASPLGSQPGLSETDEPSSADPDPTEPEILSAGDAFHDEKGKRIIFGAQQHNLIIDARPAINSIAMQVVGKGSENMNDYRFATKAYLNIQNIHVMRNSLNKVISALKDGDISSGAPNQELLVKSDWLKHITGILDGSALIARQVGIQHSHVLIHCSDGWDRTSQLSALSQIMLEPYYRTITGFIVLIEKDWLSFGHMFHQRSGPLGSLSNFVYLDDGMAGTKIEPGETDGRTAMFEEASENFKGFLKKHWSSDKDREDSDPENLAAAAAAANERAPTPVIEDQATRDKEISPVFHQFLDAVYQLLRQFPDRFEFNERFLRRLFYHLHSCQYGTFLLNNEKQRLDAKLHERTSSVWDYFLSRRDIFTNPNYDPVVDDNVRGKERLIFPRLNEVRWWYQLFNRSDQEMNGTLDAAAATSDKVAKAVQSATVSPLPGESAANSTPGTPQAPGSPSPGSSAAASFGQTVLAGVEVPQIQQNAPSTGGILSNLAKGISSLDLGGPIGPGNTSAAAGSSALPLEGQEMKQMGSSENVAQ
jgi:myotubularin-related protein 6/7/8